MITIEELIYYIYNDYNSKRKSKYISKEPPPDEPYSTTEVSVLIDSIVYKVNSFLASLVLENKKENAC